MYLPYVWQRAAVWFKLYFMYIFKLEGKSLLKAFILVAMTSHRKIKIFQNNERRERKGLDFYQKPIKTLLVIYKLPLRQGLGFVFESS